MRRAAMRAGALRALALLAAALAAGACPARARSADWRAEAPPLPLDGPLRPLAGPVAVGGSAWGPWRRICREQVTARGRPAERTCLQVAEARAEGEAMRLTLEVEGAGLRISALRDAAGRVTEFRALSADGGPAPREPARERLLAEWRAQFAALSLERRRIPAREGFDLPVHGSARGMACRAEGGAALRGRPVVVLACGVRLEGRLGREATAMEVTIFARLAVDVASGIIAAQSYATRVARLAAAEGGEPRPAGVVVTPSRVTME
jgi:hypothetical protein